MSEILHLRVDDVVVNGASRSVLVCDSIRAQQAVPARETTEEQNRDGCLVDSPKENEPVFSPARESGSLARISTRGEHRPISSV
jgi:hypothetical protein